MDPEQFLPQEIFTTVLILLDVKDVSSCALVNSCWRDISVDKSIWQSLCQSLWADKKYISPKVQDQVNDDPKEAYKESLRDAERSYLTAEELCGFTWNFRFKKVTGYHWTENDPWWQCRPAIQMKFEDNGHIVLLDDFWQANGTGIYDRKWRFIEKAAGRIGPIGSFLQVNNFPPCIQYLQF
eukprot:TRINITY_DN696_c0_g1_i2.p1 TRINITY_DN696_c0_g1~~TRINITY_DN696_c0_g1_i2.p1  ORF type:complete len:182 (-),score=3.97 TRINITY_DN696_c0_g1_i2:135-680(-)